MVLSPLDCICNWKKSANKIWPNLQSISWWIFMFSIYIQFIMIYFLVYRYYSGDSQVWRHISCKPPCNFSETVVSILKPTLYFFILKFSKNLATLGLHESNDTKIIENGWRKVVLQCLRICTKALYLRQKVTNLYEELKSEFWSKLHKNNKLFQFFGF